MRIKLFLFWTITGCSIISWFAFVIWFSFYMESWFIGVTLGTLLYTFLWFAIYGASRVLLGESKIGWKLLALIIYSVSVLLMKINSYYVFIAVLYASQAGFFSMGQDMQAKGIDLNTRKHFTKINVRIYLILSSTVSISLFFWVLATYRQLSFALSSLLLGFIIGAFYWPAYGIFIYAKTLYQFLKNSD